MGKSSPDLLASLVADGAESESEMRDRMIGTVIAQLRVTNAQLASFTVTQREMARQMEAASARMDRFEEALGDHTTAEVKSLDSLFGALTDIRNDIADNTRLTRDHAKTIKVVQDTLTTGRTLRRALIWLAGILGAAASIMYAGWQAYQVVGAKTSQGDNGIGPTP